MGEFANRIFLLFLCALLSMLIQVSQSLAQDSRPTRVVTTKHRVDQCATTVFDSPRFRGFYLYQTEREISAVFPSFHTSYIAAKDQLLPKRDLISDFREVKSDDLDEDLTKLEDYRDVTFEWQFFNEHVALLRVTYQEYEPESLDDFLEAVSSTTGLPLKAFRIVDKHTAVLTCDGFAVEIREGSYTKKSWTPKGSQITLTDTEAFIAMDEEEKEIKKQRAKEDAQKKAEAEKKKRTFKP